ncbi:MAG TPA: TolC family protein [Vicinamibacterales bacterium]|nr:TolC family protein [Vicinamibacterales bacterium]
MYKLRAMRAPVVLVMAALAGCATASPPAAQLPAQLSVASRSAGDTAVSIPAGVSLADGLSPDEAVAIALWNNADFRLQLADLGFARADLLEAGLLRNPVLSLLFPVGPKQFEGTLRLPIEVLWERPRRVAAARLAFERAAKGLEQYGLNLVADVEIAHADLALAQARADLAATAATEFEAIRAIADSRLRAGDISELEAQTARVDAARARQEAERATYDVAVRANALRARLGLAMDPAGAALTVPQSRAGTLPADDRCGDRPGLLERLTRDALASRPEVRAAEIAIEAAGARLGWEKARVATLTAVLDANGAGREGFEAGPGLDVALPVFDRNQGNRARAAAEMERASLAYVAVRQRVTTELVEALTLAAHARSARTAWQQAVVAPLEDQVRLARRAFEAGDVSSLFVLETARRLTDARLRARDIDADLARATARVERAVGRPCAARGQNER